MVPSRLNRLFQIQPLVTLRFSKNVCNITTLNRHLHHYGFHQTVVALRHHIDICMYDHGSNESTSVALHIKFQSDPRGNLMWEKVTNTQNTVFFLLFFFFWVGYMKLICYHPILVVPNKREIEYENKSTAFDRQRKTNRREKRKSRHRSW